MPAAVVGLKDQRIDFRHDVIQAVEIGPTNSAYQTVQANNPNSTSSAVFSIKPPGTNSGIGRYMRLHIEGTSVITWNAAKTAADLIAFREWPINSIIATTTANINNSSITLSNVADIVPVVNRVANSFKNMNSYQSGTATAPDILAKYSDTVGTLVSPFAAGYSMPLGDVNQSRVAQITSCVSNGSGATMTITWDISEPILNPLFQADSENVVSLVGVNQLNVNIVYANIWRLFSSTFATQVNSIVTTFQEQELLVNYVTSPDLLFKPVPSYYSVPNIRLDQAQTTGGFAIDAQKVGNSATVQLDKVPRYLVVWVSLPADVTTAPIGSTTYGGGRAGATGISDLLMPISNISINCYNQTGLLSSATQHQLYTMSCAAGLTNTTFSQFRGDPIFTMSELKPGAPAGAVTIPRYNAAPVIIPFSNLSLPLGLSPDSDQGTTLSVRVTFSYQGGVVANNSTDMNAPGYVINLMTIVDGILELDNGSSVYMYGGLSREQVMNAIEASRDEVLTVDAIRAQSMIMGAGFWDKIKSAASWFKEKIAPVAKDIYAVAKPFVHEGLQALGPEGAMASQALSAVGGARHRLSRR
jgi:hypothetical protein